MPWIEIHDAIVWGADLDDTPNVLLTLDDVEAWIRKQPPTATVGTPNYADKCPVARAIYGTYPDARHSHANYGYGWFTKYDSTDKVRVLYGAGVYRFISLVDTKKRPISRRTALALLKQARAAQEE